ncbi:hypothetical protein Aple_023650 [Acrocarpospora pleiomorpha]|uniref:Enoyl-CoA hydratase n=2 Tax=Acrocarpospora pleiomorpha TaxID=90975 RepID=A0A5M3XH17_9ACTN|nr:hypothetical protein Aple_023650 [Acrocarpospora pleiomorpha]
MAKAIRNFHGPVISAVDGPALGLGTDLALVADVCYVGETGWIEQGWGKIGAIPGIGGAYLTAHRAGKAAAWEFVMSQRRWTGPELERLGLAIAAEDAEKTAVERAQWITSKPGGAAEMYKSLLQHVFDESYDVHLERCRNYQARLRMDPARQNIAAQVLDEKR